MLKKNGFERCKIGELHKIDLTDHLERYSFASKYVSGKGVLDIACGTGYGTEMLKKAGAECVTGVDISREAIDEPSKIYNMLMHLTPNHTRCRIEYDRHEAITYKQLRSSESSA